MPFNTGDIISTRVNKEASDASGVYDADEKCWLVSDTQRRMCVGEFKDVFFLSLAG